MKLLIIRHGKAGDRADWISQTGSDFERPLTEDGIIEFKNTIKHVLKKVDAPEHIYSSPFVRCMQTADILSKFVDVKVEPLQDLAYTSSNPREVLKALKKHEHEGMVALVGHDPTLSQLVSILTIGQEAPFMVFKKGGVAMLSCNVVEAGGFVVEWLLTPKLVL